MYNSYQRPPSKAPVDTLFVMASIVFLFVCGVVGTLVGRAMLNHERNTQMYSAMLNNECTLSHEEIVDLSSGNRTSIIYFTTNEGKSEKFIDSYLEHDEITFLECGEHYQFIGGGTNYDLGEIQTIYIERMKPEDCTWTIQRTSNGIERVCK